MTPTLSDFISPEMLLNHKVLVDNSTEWTILIWIANYWTEWYLTASDTAKEIWRIMKIVIDDWEREISWPEGSCDNKYARDDVDELDFI